MVKKGYFLLAIIIVIIALVGIMIIMKKPKTAQECFETALNLYKSSYVSSKEFRKMSPEEKEEYRKMVISSADSAIKSYQKIIDKYPESKWTDDAQFCIAVAYYTKAQASVDNADRAIEANQNFITDYPEAKLDPQTMENLSFVVPKAHSNPHAAAQWQIANTYDSVKKDYPQASIEYSKVIDNYPQSRVARTTIYSITALCSKLNDYTPAIEACQKLLKTRTNITPGEIGYFKKVIEDSKAKQAALKKQG